MFHNFCSVEDTIIYIVPAKKCLDYLFNLLPNVLFFILFITPYTTCIVSSRDTFLGIHLMMGLLGTSIYTQNNTLSMMRVQTKQIFKMMIYAFFIFIRVRIGSRDTKKWFSIMKPLHMLKTYSKREYLPSVFEDIKLALWKNSLFC